MENVLLTRQRHEADRAGLHWDYRLVVGDKAHSWATKKELPKPGESIMLWEQPVHTSDYALSKRVEIPKGQYGAGVTTLDWVKKGKAELGSDKIVIHTKDGRFLLKKMPNYQDGSGWLFRNLGQEEKNMEKKASGDRKSVVNPIIKGSLLGAASGAIPGYAAGWGLGVFPSVEVGLAARRGYYSPKQIRDLEIKTRNAFGTKGALHGGKLGALVGGAIGSGVALKNYLQNKKLEKQASMENKYLNKISSDLSIAKKSKGEEDKAIKEYAERLKEAKNPILRKAIEHARKEEKTHSQDLAKAEKDIEKKAFLVQKYQNDETGVTMWHQEGKPLPGAGWTKVKGHGKYVRKGSGK